MRRSTRRYTPRISTRLFAALTVVALIVLSGLVVMSLRLVSMQERLDALRANSLPRLIELSQLSQEASATTSIAPALSTVPARSEFETLVSRIQDKEVSLRRLIGQLSASFEDPDASRRLRDSGTELIENFTKLADVVRQQIEIEKRLEQHGDGLRGLVSRLATAGVTTNGIDSTLRDHAARGALQMIALLFDPVRARLTRNRKGVDEAMTGLGNLLKHGENAHDPQAKDLVAYWSENRDGMLADKSASLVNGFRIKALAEENSLIATRLLNAAREEFQNAGDDIEAQIHLVNRTTQFTLALIVAVVVAFGVGNLVVWMVLRNRVFRRLDRLRDALRAFAETRQRAPADASADEIGEIDGSLNRYMDVIDERESQLAEKTSALERLSNQLAKYLSPQIYASIFSGQQEVKLASTRKKLTIFFSDIADFTETADRLESEELTQLLNHYLTEMSRIALAHGATIDKYVGDAILIFFGDPETRGVREDALECVRMAIEMRNRLVELGYIWKKAGVEQPLQVRMGVHTGYCTVGNFGSEDRLDYTIVGGAVNAASRLEELALPGEILVSFETYALVRDVIRCEDRGQADVKGLAYPLSTYRVVGVLDRGADDDLVVREHQPHLRVDANISAMTPSDREKAAAILLRTLGKIRDLKKFEGT